MRDFKEKYRALCARFPEVFVIRDELCEEWSKEARAAKDKASSTLDIAARAAASFWITSTSAMTIGSFSVVNFIYDSNLNWLTKLSSLNQYPLFHLNMLFIITLCAYTIFFPSVLYTSNSTLFRRMFGRLADRWEKFITDYNARKVRSRTYWGGMALLFYTLLAAIALQAHLFSDISFPMKKWFALLVLVVPFFMVSLVTPVMVYSLGIAYILGRRISSAFYSPRLAYCYYLMELYETCAQIDTSNQLVSNRDKMCQSIEKAAKALRWHAEDLRKASLIDEVKVTLLHKKVANTLALRSWIAFPKEDTAAYLRQSFLLTLNSILAGTDDDLLQEMALDVQPEVINRNRKALKISVVFLCIFLPPILYGIAISFRFADGDTLFKTLFPVGYTVWLAAIVFLAFENLTDEYRAYMLELIRTILRR